MSEFDSDIAGIAEPSGPALDPIREVVMFRLQYRNLGSHEALVGNFVTDVDGTDHGGVRWFELRRTGGAWSVQQEGTYAAVLADAVRVTARERRCAVQGEGAVIGELARGGDVLRAGTETRACEDADAPQ